MGTIYINTRQSEEHRIVIARNGALAGFEQDIAGWENKKGDIYKAVVTHIEEGLDAAFVNFGEAKNGFLPLKHVAADLPGASGGKHKLAEGDSILVQIKKDHVGDKGAGLTTNISLAGCYLVLMPNTAKDKTLMAKGGGDRQRAAAALSGLNVPDGMGVILRTTGMHRQPEDLRWELESYLLKLWRAIEEAAAAHRGPVLIYRENNLMMRAVRDYYRPGEDQIYCDDSDNYHELKNFMALISPEHADCVHYHESEGAMVPDELERQIDSIYLREIKTPSGARVVFDSTEAMVAVDVNSAQVRGHADIEETALRVNIEAADVIARHLRLRDLGGLIVVDFIDMTADKKRQKLEEYFAGLLRRDRARVQWTSLSRFGLMELSRQRLSRPVVESQGVMCQNCNGTGRQARPEAFALRLLRHIRQHLGGETGALIMQAPADAAIYLLNEKRVELRRLEDEGNCEILVVPSQNMYPPDFSIRKVQSEKRVGVSYRARTPEKNYAESVQQRIQKRGKPQAQAVVDKITPEERPVHKPSLLEVVAKFLRSIFGGGAEKKSVSEKSGKQRPRKQNSQRRRRNQNRDNRDNRTPQSADGRNRKPHQNGRRQSPAQTANPAAQPAQPADDNAAKDSSNAPAEMKKPSTAAPVVAKPAAPNSEPAKPATNMEAAKSAPPAKPSSEPAKSSPELAKPSSEAKTEAVKPPPPPFKPDPAKPPLRQVETVSPKPPENKPPVPPPAP